MAKKKVKKAQSIDNLAASAKKQRRYEEIPLRSGVRTRFALELSDTQLYVLITIANDVHWYCPGRGVSKVNWDATAGVLLGRGLVKPREAQTFEQLKASRGSYLLVSQYELTEAGETLLQAYAANNLITLAE